MNLHPFVILAILALALATGCGSMTFKRGAGPGTAKADEDACRASSDSPEAYSECLPEKGWMVRSPSSSAGPVDPAVGEEPAPAPTGSSVKEPIPAPQPTPLWAASRRRRRRTRRPHQQRRPRPRGSQRKMVRHERCLRRAKGFPVGRTGAK